MYNRLPLFKKKKITSSKYYAIKCLKLKTKIEFF